MLSIIIIIIIIRYNSNPVFHQPVDIPLRFTARGNTNHKETWVSLHSLCDRWLRIVWSATDKNKQLFKRPGNFTLLAVPVSFEKKQKKDKHKQNKMASSAKLDKSNDNIAVLLTYRSLFQCKPSRFTALRTYHVHLVDRKRHAYGLREATAYSAPAVSMQLLPFDHCLGCIHPSSVWRKLD